MVVQITLTTQKNCQLFQGAKDSIMSLRNMGYRIAIVTNQSAIMRGLWDEQKNTFNPFQITRRSRNFGCSNDMSSQN
jgi:histidinol phosphatase-like enzyme